MKKFSYTINPAAGDQLAKLLILGENYTIRRRLSCPI
jgi:hypothetical protein